MPCEPVASGVPTRPSSTNPTSSLAFRMKRLGSGGGGARRALTALGTNDTKLNVRLAKALLTISQEKFAKKWNFDPVREVPLDQGRFQWTATGSLPENNGSFSGSGCSSSSSSSGLSSSSSSHDLGAAGAEAEDNAAALRTCLSLPPGHSPTTITATAADTVSSHEPRVPPPHPEDPLCTAEPTSPTPTTLRDVPSNSSRSTWTLASDARRNVLANIDKQAGTEAKQELKSISSAEQTTTEPSSIIRLTSGTASDANRGVVDKEPPSLQDNQCQRQIDPTDTRHQQSTALTQACITNYLRPRKRSSAHLQEAVHPSKTKKVLVAA